MATSHTRRYVFGGLLSAAVITFVLALIFTIGGVGDKRGGKQHSTTQQSAESVDVKALPTDGSSLHHVKSVLDQLGGETTIESSSPAAAAAAATATTTTTGSQAANVDSAVFNQQAVTTSKQPFNLNRGDPLQAISVKKNADMDGMDMSEDDAASTLIIKDGSCWPQDIKELMAAVENVACPVIILTNPDKEAYMLMDMEEIVITRHVRIIGHPTVLPLIDASMGGMRAFRVTAGGFLELQYVRIRQCMGMERDRYGLEGLDLPSKVSEIKGGSVMIEAEAVGGTFVGVIFLATMTDQTAVTMALDQTARGVGQRIYGGHVFVADGTVNFFGCSFWDSMIFTPPTDQVILGYDVLVVAGNAFFTGCTFTNTMLFCAYGGTGWNVSVLGGSVVMTFCSIQWQSASMAHGVAGMVIFVGGGVVIMTGVDFRFVSAMYVFTGIGTFFAGAGALIMTGVTIESAFALQASFGAGMNTAVGAGVLVETGVTYTSFMGPNYQAITGAMEFVGTGSSIHVGVPASMYSSVQSYMGQGGFSYNGAGISVWIGAPLAMFAGVMSFFGLGGVTSQGAGLMVWIGNPVFMAMGIQYFAGLGGVMFVGAGSAVIARSPVAMLHGLMAYNSPSMPMSIMDHQMDTDMHDKGANGPIGGGVGGMEHQGNHGMSPYMMHKMEKDGMEDPYAMTDDEMRHMHHMMPADFWIEGNINATGGSILYVDKHDVYQAMKVVWDSDMFDNDVAANTPEHHHGGRRVEIERRRKLTSLSTLAQSFELFEYEDPSASSKLLALGLDVNKHVDMTNKEVQKGFQSWVPSNMIAGATEISKTFQPLMDKVKGSAGNGSHSEVMPDTSLKIGTQDLEYCGVCETEMVTGIGASDCALADSCDALKAQAPPGTESAFDFNDISFDDFHVIMADFKPTTSADVESISPSDFAKALQGYFKVNRTQGVQVTAFSAKPDEMFKHLMNPLKESDKATEDYSKTHHIRAAFIVTDADQANAIQEAVGNPKSNGYADLDLYVGDYLYANGIEINALDPSLNKAFFIPAYASKDFNGAFAAEVNQAAGSNSVRLVDPNNEGIPLDRVVNGQSYSVRLGAFPANSALVVQLLGSEEMKQQDGSQVLKQTATLVKGLATTGRDGSTDFIWRVPSKQATGDYYLKATDATGQVIGLSPIFTIASQRRRRLIGPSHSVML